MLLLVGVMAIVGHCFPVYLMAVGGKGIATSLGVFTALMPLVTPGCFGVGVAILLTTGYMAVASCIGVTLLPILAWLLGEPPLHIWITALLAVVLDLRHMGNARRLFAGREPKIWDKAKVQEQRDEGVAPE